MFLHHEEYRENANDNKEDVRSENEIDVDGNVMYTVVSKFKCMCICTMCFSSGRLGSDSGRFWNNSFYLTCFVCCFICEGYIFILNEEKKGLQCIFRCGPKNTKCKELPPAPNLHLHYVHT